MRMLTIVLCAFCTFAAAKDKEKAEIHYAGEGRYTCSGDAYKCAQIDANNRALEDRQRAKDDARQQREYEQRQRDLELYGVRR